MKDLNKKNWEKRRKGIMIRKKRGILVELEGYIEIEFEP